ncbi:MAG: RNA polymerase sigma factor [Saprospiraceae bacterium]|nr:RNA polymerase sigma factor [Saprospiraceae bacterium]
MTINEYNKCVDLYSDNVYRFAMKSVRDEDTANDLVQDTFMRLWQHVDKINLETAKPYLFKIANNLMIDLYRKNKFMDSNPIDSEKYSYVHEYTDLKEQLDKALDNLAQIQKTVIMLRDYEDYSYEEIGQITGLSESQVKVYIYRARKNLKDYLIESRIEL